MIYGYIRVSCDKQTVENQRFEIARFCRTHGLAVDGWIEETISGTREALARRKAEGVTLGRPRGSRSAPHKYKLHAHRALIASCLAQRQPMSAIARQCGVSRGTLARYLAAFPPRPINPSTQRQID